jgi:hypothetical protein
VAWGLAGCAAGLEQPAAHPPGGSSVGGTPESDTPVDGSDAPLAGVDTPVEGVDTTDTPDTDLDSDVGEAADTAPVVPPPPPPSPPTFRALAFVDRTTDLLCGPPAAPCMPGWWGPGGEADLHAAACTVGGWAGPADAEVTCVFDVWPRGGPRGAIRVLDRATWTWRLPDDGVADFQAARITDPVVPSREVDELQVVDVDGDGAVELLIRSERGPALSRASDGTWAPHPQIRAAWEAAGLGMTSGAGVWDLDRDGRLDLVLRGADGGLWGFYQRGDGGWDTTPFPRLAGVSSDIYAFQFFDVPGQPLVILALGALERGQPAESWVDSGQTDPQGRPIFTEVVLAEPLGAYRPMGAANVDLTGDGVPSMVVTTARSDLCPRVFQWESAFGLWFNNTNSATAYATVSQGPPIPSKCTWDATPVTREIPWWMARVHQDAWAMAWGHDASQHRECPLGIDPGCPAQSELNVWMAQRVVDGGPGALLHQWADDPASPVSWTFPDGRDAAWGNWRHVVARDLDGDGDADVEVGGAFETLPRVFENITPEPWPVCVTLRGGGPGRTNVLGLGARVAMTVAGRTTWAWPSVGSGSAEELCWAHDVGAGTVEVRWPTGVVQVVPWAGERRLLVTEP